MSFLKAGLYDFSEQWDHHTFSTAFHNILPELTLYVFNRLLLMHFLGSKSLQPVIMCSSWCILNSYAIKKASVLKVSLIHIDNKFTSVWPSSIVIENKHWFPRAGNWGMLSLPRNSPGSQFPSSQPEEANVCCFLFFFFLSLLILNVL